MLLQQQSCVLLRILQVHQVHLSVLIVSFECLENSCEQNDSLLYLLSMGLGSCLIKKNKLLANVSRHAQAKNTTSVLLDAQVMRHLLVQRVALLNPLSAILN